MPSNSDYFVRELDINLNKNTVVTLQLHQKSIGDVNCIVWDASMVLAKYLETENSKNPNCFLNMNVIELGSGVGCVGLTASVLGANVTLTDLPESLPIMCDNIAFNRNIIKNTISAKVLSWGQTLETTTKYQLILLSDCVYYFESIKPLIQTMVDLCGESTNIIQSQEIRDTEKQKEIWNVYVQELEQHFNVCEISTTEQHKDFTSTDIKLLKITKKL